MFRDQQAGASSVKTLTIAVAAAVVVGAGIVVATSRDRATSAEPATALAAGTAGSVATTSASLAPVADPAQASTVVVYKSPTCGCCGSWVDHLRAEGFTVEVHDRDDLSEIKRASGVTDNLASCHTAQVGGYVVEGHVPAGDIRRLLRERPPIAGIAVPGMPVGSPGMEVGDRRDRYDVVAFARDGRTSVFARH
jgi:hypothetical protein